VADALGVDALVVGNVARVGDEHLFSIKRLDPSGKLSAAQVTRRFQAGNGEELLAAVGPAVAELFPDVPLRPGVERGVDKEIGRRLNPPPLPPWLFVAGASTTTALALATGAVALWNGAAAQDLDTYKRTASPFAVSTFDEKAGAVDTSAQLTWGLGGAAVLVGIATAVALPFTDFASDEEVLP
jgi:hypothetical protein